MPNHCTIQPMRNRMTERRTIFHNKPPFQVKLNLRSEKYMATPITNMKKGNTRSVGVSPIHSACSKGR